MMAAPERRFPDEDRNMTARETKLPPIRPGEILLEEFMKPLRLSANRLAMDLHVPGTRIHAIVNGKRDITPDTAMRLARYFGTTVEVWMNLQMRYDLEKAEDENRERIDREVLPLRDPSEASI
jgi:antitoxin HigA-1